MSDEQTSLTFFRIKSRFTGNVQFECELAAEIAGCSFAVRLGFAVKQALASGADLRDANLRGFDIPIVPNIDAAILAAITAGGTLDMHKWHTCETTHCRAGWAIALAGEAGAALERKCKPAAAGALIYAASRPGKRVPDFYTANEDAMADIEACAQEVV